MNKEGNAEPLNENLLKLGSDVISSVTASADKISSNAVSTETDSVCRCMIKLSMYKDLLSFGELYCQETSMEDLNAMAASNPLTALRRLFIRNLIFKLKGEDEQIRLTLHQCQYSDTVNIFLAFANLTPLILTQKTENQTASPEDMHALKLCAETALAESEHYKMSRKTTERFLHLLIFAGLSNKAEKTFEAAVQQNLLKNTYAPWLSFLSWAAGDDEGSSLFAEKAEGTDCLSSDLQTKVSAAFTHLLSGRMEKVYEVTESIENLPDDFPTTGLGADITYLEYYLLLVSLIFTAQNSKQAEPMKRNASLKSHPASDRTFLYDKLRKQTQKKGVPEI